MWFIIDFQVYFLRCATSSNGAFLTSKRINSSERNRNTTCQNISETCQKPKTRRQASFCIHILIHLSQVFLSLGGMGVLMPKIWGAEYFLDLIVHRYIECSRSRARSYDLHESAFATVLEDLHLFLYYHPWNSRATIRPRFRYRQVATLASCSSLNYPSKLLVTSPPSQIPVARRHSISIPIVGTSTLGSNPKILVVV